VPVERARVRDAVIDKAHDLGVGVELDQRVEIVLAELAQAQPIGVQCECLHRCVQSRRGRCEISLKPSRVIRGPLWSTRVIAVLYSRQACSKARSGGRPRTSSSTTAVGPTEVNTSTSPRPRSRTSAKASRTRA